mmetsp:Transcript_27569/g.57782  ORF Transcript_27569/g.57782 Transcript_27569/m.57782 type:complete len:214 (-) Transcript_27569:43-684(-)
MFVDRIADPQKGWNGFCGMVECNGKTVILLRSTGGWTTVLNLHHALLDFVHAGQEAQYAPAPICVGLDLAQVQGDFGNQGGHRGAEIEFLRGLAVGVFVGNSREGSVCISMVVGQSPLQHGNSLCCCFVSFVVVVDAEHRSRALFQFLSEQLFVVREQAGCQRFHPRREPIVARGCGGGCGGIRSDQVFQVQQIHGMPGFGGNAQDGNGRRHR